MQLNHRSTVTLLLGGVRSGKSHHQQQLGERAPAGGVCGHGAGRRRRDVSARLNAIAVAVRSIGKPWEEPLALAEAIAQHGPTCDLMIIDCLTFFAANLLDAEADEQISIDGLCSALQSPPCSVVLVSNEVGSSVVPEYPSGRRFRDLLGEMNQSVAGVASNVLLLVAGLPLVLKGQLEVSSAEAVSTNAQVSHEVSPEVSPEVSQ